MTFEFTDTVKGLEELLDITRALQKWERTEETAPTAESKDKLKFWRQVRDRWMEKHKAKDHASH